jgi:hypothetical protein
MPRNDQVTRQWHLLRLLESSHGVTIDEIVSPCRPITHATDGLSVVISRRWRPLVFLF